MTAGKRANLGSHSVAITNICDTIFKVQYAREKVYH